MEKNRICKICNRRFSNGKAMGGHMRSHLSKLPLPHYPNSLSSSSSHNNPSQSYRSLNHELLYKSNPNLDPPQFDGESETESPRCTTSRRSKRRRKSAVKVLESSPEQVSSISDEILNDEDVALCLLMLSEGKQTEKQVRDYQTGDEDEDEVDEDEDDWFGEDEIPAARSKSSGKYRCETCKKMFRSYQALGGHKANHKKIGAEDDAGNGSSSGVFVDRRIFKCPFCDKVFDSGQALGGHKKVHFSYLGNNVNKITPPKSKSGDNMNLLDLNLPAPEEEDDELELSQVYEQRNR